MIMGMYDYRHEHRHGSEVQAMPARLGEEKPHPQAKAVPEMPLSVLGPGAREMSVRHKNGGGYFVVKAPDGDPRADYRGNIREHVLIAQNALGKPLPRTAHVHHVDLCKVNNANTNLVICENEAYHKLLHVRTRVKMADGDPNTDKICSLCKATLSKSAFSPDRTRYDGLAHACDVCNAGRARNDRKNKNVEGFVPRPIGRPKKGESCQTTADSGILMPKSPDSWYQSEHGRTPITPPDAEEVAALEGEIQQAHGATWLPRSMEWWRSSACSADATRPSKQRSAG